MVLDKPARAGWKGFLKTKLIVALLILAHLPLMNFDFIDVIKIYCCHVTKKIVINKDEWIMSMLVSVRYWTFIHHNQLQM